MFKRIVLFAGIALLIPVAIILFNTFRSRPWPVKHDAIALSPLPDSAIQHLSHAVQIQTISISDTSAVDTTAFKAFNSFIENSYPLVHKNLSKTTIRGFSYVFEWKGLNESLAPIVLMSHYDVVPVEPSALDKWTVAPFSGAITDTCVWGRGTTDDKFGVISILEATEAMLRKGFAPQRTIYLCFGHDEEISGQGAKAIVDFLEQKNLRPEMVLDEGGQLSESRVKDVKRPIAVIGVAEKGYASFQLSVEKEGGHSSMPAKETAIDILNTALYRLRKKTPSSKLTPQLREFAERIGLSSDNFLNRMAASNLWLFGSVAKSKLSAEPEGDAMMHTTIVPTIIESGIKDNVVPTHAFAIINSRIMPGETSANVEDFIRKAINDERVKIKKTGKYDSDPSPATSTDSHAFRRIESALYKNVAKVIPVPYLGIGATDSRYYRRISDGVVNFLPMTDAKGYHGINERLPVLDLQRGINFIMTIIEENNKEFKQDE
jgi:carboxypeptidase PM20D1